MTGYLIVEGPKDAEVFRRLFQRARVPGVEIVLAGGKARVSSIARTLLSTRDAPVAVAVDSDTTDRERSAEQREELESSLGLIAGTGRFRVIQMEPSIESLWTRHLSQLRRVLGLRRLPPNFEAMAAISPKAALQTIQPPLGWTARATGEFPLSLLDEQYADALLRDRQVAGLVEFFKRSIGQGSGRSVA